MQLAQLVKSYKSVAVTTATPGQLVLMLFDGALRFLTAAERSFAEEHPLRRNESIHNNIVRAQNIILELQHSLDMRVEGGFPQRMFALYDFMNFQLNQANIKKDVAPIQVVSELLGEIRDAWAQMLETSANQVR